MPGTDRAATDHHPRRPAPLAESILCRALAMVKPKLIMELEVQTQPRRVRSEPTWYAGYLGLWRGCEELLD